MDGSLLLQWGWPFCDASVDISAYTPPSKYQKRPFVHDSVCSQFLVGFFFWRVFFLFEVLSSEIQEEIHHFSGWEGGGLKGTKIVNKHFANYWAFPKRLTNMKKFRVGFSQNGFFADFYF